MKTRHLFKFSGFVSKGIDRDGSDYVRISRKMSDGHERHMYFLKNTYGMHYEKMIDYVNDVVEIRFSVTTKRPVFVDRGMELIHSGNHVNLIIGHVSRVKLK